MTSLIKEPSLKMVAAGAGSRLMGSENASLVLGEALDISGAAKPTVLTIATAEPTREWHDEFVEKAQQQFSRLGANVVNLHEFGTMPSPSEIDDKIARADTIWVAGGSTQEMIKKWKKHDIDIALTEAARRGTVLGGGSAGMLAWLKQGHSDSESYDPTITMNRPWEYIFVKGLGYIKVAGTPHFDSIEDDGKVRRDDFIEKFIADPSLPTTGIGIDNMAALSIIDGHYRVIQVPGDADFAPGNVHILKKTADGLDEDKLPVSSGYKPFDI